MLEDLWDDDGFEEPTLAPVSKHHNPEWKRVQTIPYAQPEVLFCRQFCSLSWQAQLCPLLLRLAMQEHAAVCQAKTSDIQRLKQLHHAVEEAEAELETSVEALSLLTLQAGKSKQLVATMQVPLPQVVLPGCMHDCSVCHVK